MPEFIPFPTPGAGQRIPGSQPSFPSGRALGFVQGPPRTPPGPVSPPPARPPIRPRPGVSAPGVPPFLFPGLAGQKASDETEEELNRKFIEWLLTAGMYSPVAIGRTAVRDAGVRVASGIAKQRTRKVTQEQFNRQLLGIPRDRALVRAGPRRVKTREQLRKEQLGRFAKIGIGSTLASVLLRSSAGPQRIPEISVTPKARTVDLTKVKPKAAATSKPKGAPKVSIGTLRKLFPWIAAGVATTLLRPKIRVVDTSGRLRDAETVSDIPLPTNVAVPLLTGFPLTQTQPQRLGSGNCQIVQRRRRRKGRCREGFFRETPTGTKYITWRSKKCR